MKKEKFKNYQAVNNKEFLLARSLVKNAKILLLDEPLVNLDYKLREQLREEFKNIFIHMAYQKRVLLFFQQLILEKRWSLMVKLLFLMRVKFLQVGAAKEIFENPKNVKSCSNFE